MARMENTVPRKFVSTAQIKQLRMKWNVDYKFERKIFEIPESKLVAFTPKERAKQLNNTIRTSVPTATLNYRQWRLEGGGEEREWEREKLKHIL
jgi:hypothetical protein